MALQKLEACPTAMESLGTPPLKVHNIHLTDRSNRIDQHMAKVLCFKKLGKAIYLIFLMNLNLYCVAAEDPCDWVKNRRISLYFID